MVLTWYCQGPSLVVSKQFPNQGIFYFRTDDCQSGRKCGTGETGESDISGRSYEGFQPGKDGMPGPVNGNFPFAGGLYDLRRDPGERYDVSESYPEIVKKLERIAEDAREDLGDDLTDNLGKNKGKPGIIKD